METVDKPKLKHNETGNIIEITQSPVSILSFKFITRNLNTNISVCHWTGCDL